MSETPLVEMQSGEAATWGARPDASVEWRDRELSNRFSTAVVELVRQAYPDVIGDEP